MPPDRVIEAGKYRAHLVADGQLGEQLRSLLADLFSPDTTRPAGRIEVYADGADSYVICSDGRFWGDSVREPELADEVIRMLLRAALDEESSFVHIHAGAVTLGDGTAILAGWPASGKSTAITALVGSGFGYVTDERLAVSSDGDSVSGFPKPISLIAGSFDTLAHLDPRRTGRGYSSGATWQVPASSVGPVEPQEFRAPSVLVFITYRANAALRIVDVAPHAAAARLLGDSPDVIIRGHEGVRAIVNLVSSIPCFELEYSATTEMVGVVRALLERPREFGPWTPLPLEGTAAPGWPAPSSPSEVGTSSPYAVVEGVSVWVIGDHAVSYVGSTGEVVEVDELGTTWLQLLDGVTSIDELIDEVAEAMEADPSAVRTAARHAVHGLWSAGVVGPI